MENGDIQAWVLCLPEGNINPPVSQCHPACTHTPMYRWHLDHPHGWQLLMSTNAILSDFTVCGCFLKSWVEMKARLGECLQYTTKERGPIYGSPNWLGMGPNLGAELWDPRNGQLFESCSHAIYFGAPYFSNANIWREDSSRWYRHFSHCKSICRILYLYSANAIEEKKSSPFWTKGGEHLWMLIFQVFFVPSWIIRK